MDMITTFVVFYHYFPQLTILLPVLLFYYLQKLSYLILICYTNLNTSKIILQMNNPIDNIHIVYVCAVNNSMSAALKYIIIPNLL